MTLDTRVYVMDRIDYREVFIECNQLIGAHEGIRFTDGPGEIGNAPEQGLPGWLIVYHGNGAPLRGPDEHARYCDGEADDCFAPCAVPCWLEVSLDTAYSYRGQPYSLNLGEWEPEVHGKGEHKGMSYVTGVDGGEVVTAEAED